MVRDNFLGCEAAEKGREDDARVSNHEIESFQVLYEACTG